MAEITVLNHVTLDGVMQGPAGPDEDPRDGFRFGGWAAARTDHVMNDRLGRSMAQGGALLFGRRTYEQFAAYWPHQTDNPYTELLDRQTKYVVSSSLTEPLPWQNSVLLESMDAVAQVKASTEQPLTVLGSGVLVASLRERDLVDRYVLLVHPVLLGSGHRLLTGGTPPAELTLTESLVTTTGVVIATYERAR
jgi:dihydrofolate reductase